MLIKIVGGGVFGSFLRRELTGAMDLVDPLQEGPDASEFVIMAVPHYAYDEVARRHRTKHLVNVCSIQSITTETCLKYTDRVTSIHPMFGPRTPEGKRFFILTHQCRAPGEEEFLASLRMLASRTDFLSPEVHDKLMVRIHASFVKAVQMIKPLVDEANDVPDSMIPNSFRKLREVVAQLDDMPPGTLESIMANPYL